jgi:phosphohistidine phosphatase
LVNLTGEESGMDLYLIRHADAVPLGENKVNEDAERPLTDLGREQSRQLAAGLRRRGVELNIVLTSPLLRARQTAEGMLDAWEGPRPDLQVCEELAPGGKRRKLSRFIRELGREKVAVVGHQPDLGEYAAWLIGSKKVHVEIAKAGVAYIPCANEPGRGMGSLVWLVTPEWMSK